MKFSNFNPTSLVALLLIIFTLISGGVHKTPLEQRLEQSPSYGSITPVGATQFTLAGAGINSTATTIQLTSFTTPDGRPITMAMLGSIGYGALEPQTVAKIEDITFTGVVQNTNGTASLTGVTRGNDFVTPYAASSTLAHAHAGGSTFILTNTAGFYTQFYSLANIATSTNILTFSSTTPPRYDNVAAQGTGSYIASTSEFASVAYVNTVALVSAPNGSTAAKGVYQTATGLQAASSTALGSTGASLVLAGAIATDTPSTPQSVSGSKVIMSQITGYLRQTWLNLTEAFTFSSTTMITANVGTLTATSTTNLAGPVIAPNTWALLTSTTTSVAMKVATSTVTGTPSDIRVTIDIPTASTGAGTYQMAFNGDAGNNYGISWTNNQAGAAAVANGFSASSPISISGNSGGGSSTTSPAFFDASIRNVLANRKSVLWRGTLSDASSDSPLIITGGAIWNNTSATITTIQVMTTGTSLPTGTTIKIYGSN